MNKKPYLLIATMLVVIASLVSGAALGKLFTTPPVQAQQVSTESRAVATQKWEYCTVDNSTTTSTDFGKTVSYLRICYLRSDGYQCETVQATVDKDQRIGGNLSDNAATAKVVAKLGDEGWQMVGEGTPFLQGERKALYFKRPKS